MRGMCVSVDVVGVWVMECVCVSAKGREEIVEGKRVYTTSLRSVRGETRLFCIRLSCCLPL